MSDLRFIFFDDDDDARVQRPKPLSLPSPPILAGAIAGVPSSSWLDEDAQAFDGATSVTNLGLRTEGLSHKCDLYGYTNPFALSFAYIHKDTKAFRVMTDEGLNRAMM